MNLDLENNKMIEKILSVSRWAISIRLFAQIFNWAITIIVVRYISSSDYGLNAMLETPLELLILFSTIGLDIALVRARTLNQEEIQSAFGYLLIINSALFALYFYGGFYIASYFNEPRLQPVAQVLAFIFVLIPFRIIPNALLDRELKFKLKALAELASSITAALVTLALATMGAGVWSLVGGFLANRIIITIILMVIQPWFIKPSFNFNQVRKLIVFGGTMTLASTIATTGYMIPAFVGGPRLGAELLGIFVVSLQFALMPLTKVMPILTPIIFPVFSKFQGQPEVIAHYLEKSIGLAGIVLLPSMIGLACIAEEFVLVVMGDRWLPAILPLALLSLSTPFRGLTSYIRQILAGVGHPILVLKSAIIFWITFVILVHFGSGYGVIGIVIATLITEPIILLVTIHLSKIAIPTTLFAITRSLKPALFCSLIMAGTVITTKELAINEQLSWRLLYETIAGVFSYIIALRLLFFSEFKNALKLIKGKK